MMRTSEVMWRQTPSTRDHKFVSNKKRGALVEFSICLLAVHLPFYMIIT